MTKVEFFKMQDESLISNFAYGYLACFCGVVTCLMDFFVDRLPLQILSAVVFMLLTFITVYKKSTLSVIIGLVYYIILRIQGYVPNDSLSIYIFITLGFSFLFYLSIRSGLEFEKRWKKYQETSKLQQEDDSSHSIEQNENSDTTLTDTNSSK